MKSNFLFLALCSSLLFSCSTSKIVTNAPSFYTFETSKTYEQVWSSIIDYVTTKGVSIKNIDKASGIIVTDDYSLMTSFTYEDKKGNLIKPDAYVVINKVKGGFGNTINPDYLRGNYNIRVKSIGDKVSVTVNLVNLTGAVKVGQNMYGNGGYLKYYNIKSTNVFEKQLAENIK